MRCPGCSQDIPQGSRFCPECGTALCPSCGTLRVGGAPFCSNCGQDLRGHDMTGFLFNTDETSPVLTPEEQIAHTQEIPVSPLDVPADYDPSGRYREGRPHSPLAEAEVNGHGTGLGIGCALAVVFGLVVLVALAVGAFWLFNNVNISALSGTSNGQTQENLANEGTTEAVPESVKTPLTKDESFTELTNIYNTIGLRDTTVNTLMQTYNGAVYKDRASRQSSYTEALDFKNQLEDERNELMALSVSPEYLADQQVLGELYTLLYNRVDVLCQAYERSLEEESTAGRMGYINEPFVENYAPGTQRSRHKSEFTELYPNAKPEQL